MIANPTRPAHGADASGDVDDFDDFDTDPIVGTSIEPFVDERPAHRGEDGGFGDHVDGVSDAAERCIARFADLEADVTSADPTGVGRVSAVRFPRLGSVLHGRVVPGSRAAAVLTIGTQRTVRAGYQAAVATQRVARAPLQHRDPDELWEAFVPAGYRIPRHVATVAWDVCRLDEFWVDLLIELGLHHDARRFESGLVSPLSRSIRGLSTVGVALALTERGGRHERLSGRRGIRGQRRALPPATQLVLDELC